MGKHLYADPMACTGCRICQLVCSFDKTGTLNPDRARVRVERYDDGRDVVISCHNCEDAPCVAVCPTEAISRDGVLRINAEECVGCGACVDACPYEAIWLDPVLEVAIACEVCGRCVPFCPPEALRIVDGG